MDIGNLPELPDSLKLRLDYELTFPAASRKGAEAAEAAVEGVKKSVSRAVSPEPVFDVNTILVPFENIVGKSRTVNRANPKCASSVRENLRSIFGILLPAKATAKKLNAFVQEEIASGNRVGFIGKNILSGLVQGYRVFLIELNSPKRPKAGHAAIAFQLFGEKNDGDPTKSLYVIDTELPLNGEKSGEPVSFQKYLELTQNMGYRIRNFTGLPTNRTAIGGNSRNPNDSDETGVPN